MLFRGGELCKKKSTIWSLDATSHKIGRLVRKVKLLLTGRPFQPPRKTFETCALDESRVAVGYSARTFSGLVGFSGSILNCGKR